jgi:hypothetical protein
MARAGKEFPLQRPGCGVDIRLIAFITEPGSIRKILTPPVHSIHPRFLATRLTRSLLLPTDREYTPARSADKHLPEAHWRNPSILSPAVTATGTTFCAAWTSGTSKSDASLQHDLISAPVQLVSSGRACFAFSHVSSEPNTRAVTPESVCPDDVAPASAFSISSQNSTHGAIASAHDFRRAFGVRWAARLMPAQLMELMRHESIETTLRFYVGTDAQRTAEAAWAAFDALQRVFAGPFAHSFANSASSGGADAAPPDARSALEITEPNQTRPGVIRTHDQGIMSGDEPEE